MGRRSRPAARHPARRLGGVLVVLGEPARAEAVRGSAARAPSPCRPRSCRPALRCLAGAAFIGGDYEEARTLHEESLALSRELGDERGVSMVLPRLAMEAHRAGLVDQSAALSAEIGSRWWQAVSL